jgi:ABC-type multidrug transport system fused ATPase/permease subunit
MMPLRTATEFANKAIRAFVAARRIVRVLQLEPEIDDPAVVLAGPEPGADLVDLSSGVRVRAGRLTAIVSDPPELAAEIVDRLGRFSDGDVRWGDVALADLSRAEVRRRIVVSDTSATLFSGRLADQVDIRLSGQEMLANAMATASAYDVLDALPDGYDTVVTEKGRSFSGGQRQRLVLARALTADPEVLLMVEPTSAVDAHTEARIAERLRAARAGRTTVVTTSSPLMLDRVDSVCFVLDGTLVAEGDHHELLASMPRYRAVVTREVDAEEGALR